MMWADGQDLLHAATIFAAGFLAGAINLVVGAGTLVSFPIPVLLGYPPLSATVANTIGIVPGSVSGVIVYRHELRAHLPLVRTLLPASAGGGVVGAVTLLHLSAEVFTTVLPWLIGVGTLLVIAGPTIRRMIVRPTTDGDEAPSSVFPRRGTRLASVAGAFLLGVYGGYFSAAQGILLIALLGVTTTLLMQELNALKNLTVAVVNVVAATVFVCVSPNQIEWPVVALVAAGSTAGGWVGGRFARRLPAGVFRAFVVIVGVATVVALLVRR